MSQDLAFRALQLAYEATRSVGSHSNPCVCDCGMPAIGYDDYYVFCSSCVTKHPRAGQVHFYKCKPMVDKFVNIYKSNIGL